MTTALFNAVYAGLTEARCSVLHTRTRTTVERCLSPTGQKARQPSEVGGGIALLRDVRMLASDEPTAGAFAIGEEMQIKPYGATSYEKTRIVGLRNVGTILGLTLEDVAQ